MTAEEFAFKLEHKARIKRNCENDRMKQYYRKQKLFGVLFLAISVILFNLFRSVPELVIVGFISAGVGLYIMSTKHMLLVDSYFMEMQSKGKLI